MQIDLGYLFEDEKAAYLIHDLKAAIINKNYFKAAILLARLENMGVKIEIVYDRND